MSGEPAPRMGQTLSEICDNEEKEQIFNHTMQSGVFKNIHDSPLKEKMPKGLTMWTPGNTGGFQTFGREHEAPMTNWPGFKKQTPKQSGLKLGSDF